MRAPPSPPAWSKNRPVSSSLSPIREAAHDGPRVPGGPARGRVRAPVGGARRRPSRTWQRGMESARSARGPRTPGASARRGHVAAAEGGEEGRGLVAAARQRVESAGPRAWLFGALGTATAAGRVRSALGLAGRAWPARTVRLVALEEVRVRATSRAEGRGRPCCWTTPRRWRRASKPFDRCARRDRTPVRRVSPML